MTKGSLLASVAVVAALTASAAPSRAAEVVEVRDGARLRIGFDIDGGIVDAVGESGPAFGAQLRLGAQINHLFGLYYQNTPLVSIITPPGGLNKGAGAAAADYNSVLGSLVFLHFFEVAAGPSLDFLDVGACGTAVACKGISGTDLGLATRAAIMLGGLRDRGPRRRAFTISANVHPIFVTGGTVLSATLGLGADWY